MDKAQLRKLVLDVLRACQEKSGRAWRELEDGHKVIGELDGFDSISGIEATTLVEQQLVVDGVLRELALTSLFVQDQEPLSIGGCIELLFMEISRGRGHV